MSVIETIKSAVTGPLNKAVNAQLGPQLAQRLAVATAALTKLRAEHGALALAVEMGEADAEKKMGQWRGAVAKAEARIIDLESAHRVAVETDAAAVQEQAARKREADIRSVTQRLALAHKAAVKMRSAIENYADAFRDMERYGAEAAKTARDAGLLWEGSKRDPRTGTVIAGNEWDETTMCRFDNLVWHTRLELLRVGHGPELSGDFEKRVPGAMDYQAALGRLTVDPMDNADMPLRGSGAIHDHDAAAFGKPVLFAAVKPIDERFDRQRQRLLAIIKGETFMPAAQPSPPVELFIGTTQQERPQFGATTPPPIVTPSASPADPNVVTRDVKLMAERQAIAVAGAVGVDLMGQVETKFGAPMSGVPRERWTELVAFYDAFVAEKSAPQQGDKS